MSRALWALLQVLPQLVMTGLMIALDRSVLDGAVHPLDLTVGLWTVWLNQAMLIFLCSQVHWNECKR